MDSSDEDYVEDVDVPVKNNKRSHLRGKSGGGEHTGYRWEDEYQRSWDVVQEDAGGSLATTIAGMVEDNKRRRIVRDTRPIQRGIIRNMVLVVDMSSAMNDTDLRPTRLAMSLDLATEFVTEFFSQNPISQLAIIGIRDGLAHLISPLDGNPDLHNQKIKAARKETGNGVPSLQNALEMARAILFHVPIHNTREVLVIFGALMSSDPGPIHKTINQLVAEKIRVRIVGLAAEVAVCKQIVMKTNHGDKTAYNIVLNESHFKELVMETTVPLAISESTAKSSSVAVKMGFPRRTKHANAASLCACHGKLTKQGYSCPQCRSKVCSLPMVCPLCQLTLILSTHLARSYHHLFPLANFKQLDENGIPQDEDQNMDRGNCFGCMTKFESHHNRYECPKCLEKFCVDCDLFCHNTLHNCPGCDVKPV